MRVVERRILAERAARNERLDHLYELVVDESKSEAKRVRRRKVEIPRMSRSESDEVGERELEEGVDGSNHAKAREELGDGDHSHALKNREARQGANSNHLDTSHQGWRR